MEMPKGFLWGGSVSAHQTEGGIEKEYGKGLSIYDYLTSKGARDFSAGIDTYHRFKEDAKLLKELGLNCYRFSIAWSRVLPDGETEINQQGLAFYDQFIDSLLENGIEPIICLYHFDIPLSLQEKYQGWFGRETIAAFEKYTRIIMERYKGKVRYYIPMNEQNWCPLVSLIASGIKETYALEKARYQLMHNMALALANVVKIGKEVDSNIIVLGMINASPVYPQSSNPEDVLVAKKINETINHDLLHLLVHGNYSSELLKKMEHRNVMPTIKEEDMKLLKENPILAIGVSYYMSMMAGQEIKGVDPIVNMFQGMAGGKSLFQPNPNLQATEWGWTIDHTGLRIMLNDIYQRYHLPLYILESGIGVDEELNEDNTIEDDYRIDYFTKQIKAVKDAMYEDFVDVRSFVTWAPIDILSSQGEMKKRYGFIFVNRTDDDLKDMKRYKKKSFSWFNEVIKTNGKIYKNQSI